MTLEWTGVMPAVTTKFTADDQLDLAMFETNIKAQVDAGVTGIVLGGTLGEASTLTDDEKRVLIQETVRIVQDKAHVIINIAEQTTKGAVEAAQKAKQYGANGLMALPPMRYKSTDYETVQYFKTIASSTDLPIMIYNNPVDYKIEVTLDMFEELIKHDNITAVKESTRDITNVTRIRNRFPKETVAICNLVKVGRIEEALEIYRWFMPLLELDISPQLVQNIKLAEVGTGLGTEFVREPRLPLQGAERERVQKIITDGLRTRPTLPEYKSLV
jgi:4-hydroxy-tetrahydrodipicolinate synthase